MRIALPYGRISPRSAEQRTIREQQARLMGKLKQIEDHVRNLSPEELAKFRAWFAEFDAEAWDRQIEADSKAGKLDRLIEKSLEEHKAGNRRPL